MHRRSITVSALLATAVIVAGCSDSPTDPAADGPLRYELCTIPLEADAQHTYRYDATFFYEEEEPSTRSGSGSGSSNPPALTCGPARSTDGRHSVGASVEVEVEEGALRAVLRRGTEDDFDWDSPTEPTVVAEEEGSAGSVIVLQHGSVQ